MKLLNILVLGSAAGGGFPQWNCNCPNCNLARSGATNTRARTQSSLAVSSDGKRWVLLNASPDIRQQISENHQLHPQNGARHSPISSVILTNADVDHVAGLLTLRERQALSIYATERVQSVLESNNIFNVLNAELVERRSLTLEKTISIMDRNNEPLGVNVQSFIVPGKVALYLEDPDSNDNYGSVPEDTIGLYISTTDGNKGFYYIPGCAAMPETLKDRISDAELVFMDGTSWINDEMSQLGVGEKTSARMGHMTMSGPDGSMAALSKLNIKRKVFVHINNTNPILVDDSEQHKEVIKAGWEIAHDGLEIKL